MTPMAEMMQAEHRRRTRRNWRQGAGMFAVLAALDLVLQEWNGGLILAGWAGFMLALPRLLDLSFENGRGNMELEQQERERERGR